MDDEIWKPVVGYEQEYQISNHGRVRRVLKVGHRLRAPVYDARGYHVITLSSANVKKFFCVHALVMAAFVGPRPEGQEVCHNDGDRANSDLRNLRYDTHSANLLDRRRHGTSSTNAGEENAMHLLSEEAVRDIRNSSASAQELADKYGVSRAAIWDAKSKRRWLHVK